MQLKRYLAIPACCAALALPFALFAQSGMSQQPNVTLAARSISPAESLSAVFSELQEEVIGAAEAMPADKYDFAPKGPGEFTGVRTFGQQVRHVAQANYHFFHGWGVAGDIDPKTLNSLTTKVELVKALRDSFAFEQAAINSITPENAFAALPGPPQMKLTRVSMVAYSMAHSRDHYGQMVEYLRMNGIIPPASRK
ncbi:MAG: DinB family protein [Silvibacterium sp.]